MKTILQHTLLLNFLFFLCITFSAFSTAPIDKQCHTTNTCRQADSLTLLTIYYATNGPNWTSSWDLNQPMDTWSGVTLDANGCVAEIFLGYDAVGYIPATLGDLSELKVLELYYADFSNGAIPSELGNLSKLETLIITGCQLTGGIPAQIGNLNNLTSLSLSSNDGLNGIPSELGNLANLTSLSINNNDQLGGSIPPELGNLTNLTELFISNNISDAL